MGWGGGCYDLTVVSILLTILQQFPSYNSFNLTTVSILQQLQSYYSFNLTIVSILLQFRIQIREKRCFPLVPFPLVPVLRSLTPLGLPLLHIVIL